MTISFLIFAALIVVSAVGVVLFRNPIHSALSLVGNLLCVAALFASLNAHFLAAVQMIVYAGAIMVLVVFVLMLLNIKTEKLGRKESLWYAIAAVLAIVFVSFLVPLLSEFFVLAHPVSSLALNHDGPLGDVKGVGEVLYTQYLFVFELASILIMAALVGAVMLAKRNYRKSGTKE